MLLAFQLQLSRAEPSPAEGQKARQPAPFPDGFVVIEKTLGRDIPAGRSLDSL
jgi:hypothetical protein